MTTLYRYVGNNTFGPVNGGSSIFLEDQAWDADLGSVGNRPAVATPPGASDTGIRQPYTQTLTGPEALAAVLAAPVEADGFRYLRRTQITSTVTFSDPAVHSALRFDDCLFPDGGNYQVNGDYATGSPPAVFPEFRFCTITGGNISTIQGCGVRYLRCNISYGTDNVKIRGTGGEFYACFIHGNNRPPDGHCDTFQIRSGGTGVVIHWCNCINLNAPNSETNPGEPGNGVLQTGSTTNDIGPVYWYDNWFDGGGYTIRVGSASDLAGHSREYVFRRNKFGRNYRYGPVYGPHDDVGMDFDQSNVFSDTGLAVV